MHRPALPVLFVLVVVNATTHAAPVVTCDSGTLLANTPNQLLTISVAGGEAVELVNFYAFFDTSVSTPKFTNVDLVTGTIFAGKSYDLYPMEIGSTGGYPGYISQSLGINDLSSVAATGRLATLTVDTTGFTIGQSFTLGFVGAGDLTGYQLDFGSVPATLNSRTITLVPEPASFALLALTGLALLHRRRTDF